MQVVGGSKGANDQGMSDIYDTAMLAVARADSAQLSLFKPYTSVVPAIQQMLDRLGPTEASWTGNVNFQNNIRKGDDTFTPLQFVYEAADCRFFYTADMLADQTVVWERAYAIQWGNGTCVQGSTGQPSSGKGFDNSYITAYPPVGANNTFGVKELYSYPGAYSIGEHPTSTSSAAASTSTGSSPTSSIAPSKGGAARNLGGFASTFSAVVFALLWM